MSVRLTPLVTAGLFALIVLASCGGSSGDGADGEGAVSKAEYVQRANAACRQERAGLEGEMAEYLARHESDGEPEEELNAGMAQDVLLPMIERQLGRVESLPEPPAEHKQISAMFAAERIAVDSIAVKDRLPSVGAAEQRLAESGEELRAYGLDECANGP